MKFSPSTKLFYDPDLAYINAPKDLIELTEEQYQSASSAISDGGSVFVENDQLVVTPADPVTVEAKQQAQAWQVYQAQAKGLLAKSDQTIMRCVENGVTVPSAWKSYRNELREIVRTSSGYATQTLPIQPPYPDGT